ncbi:MAG: energy transducer TonB [Brevundimonas sp.]|nr:energy transducer TonB [Brevundimonas sp.]
MLTMQQPDKSRVMAALGSAAITAALGYALLAGFGVRIAPTVARELDVFILAPDAPVPPIKPPPPPKHSRRNGASGAPALRAKATDIVAPPPILPVVSPTIAVAKIANVGSASTTGASSVAGSGNGGGGLGNGDGDGDGGETPPQYRSGRIRDSDFPRGAGEAGVGGTVSVEYTVTTKGRATNCMVTRSSGNVELDRTTCRLIEERFRYSPSRDARGKPVESMIVENHSWAVRRDEQPN